MKPFTLPPGAYPFSNQLEWAVARHAEYLASTGSYSVGVRRLHYWLVTRPMVERIIPSRGKNLYRYYENKKSDCQRLSTLLVEARIKGRIDPFSVVDEKNGPAIFMPTRQDIVIDINTHCDIPGSDFSFDSPEYMPDWNDYIETLYASVQVHPPTFTHQSHRLVVAIEKATAQARLQNIVQTHGADLLIFSGQFSVSRVFDVASAARAEDKPIALFYISDLDCAGWDMPTAFYSRLQEIYPNPDHTMVRVGLTRVQATEYNLPVSFDPDTKEYKEVQKERFFRESGGKDCIELDALDEKTILSLLRNQLERWSYLQDDTDEYYETQKSVIETRDGIEFPSILKDYQRDYSLLSDRYNSYIDEVDVVLGQLPDGSTLQTEKDNLEQKIRVDIRDAIRKAFSGDNRVRVDPVWDVIGL